MIVIALPGKAEDSVREPKESRGQEGAAALGASAFKDTAMGIGEYKHPRFVTGPRFPDKG